MNRKIYPKLAWSAIHKNKQLYVPYLLAGVVMVSVFYILSFLTESPVVGSLKGSSVMTVLLKMATGGVGLFSVPFLFYTNSTLLKRRKKELGLYNILGMNKRNIFHVLAWETLMTFGIAVVGGLAIGILLSKFAELGLLNIMNEEINYRVYVDWKCVLLSVIVFAVVYVLILLNTLRQIHSNNPIELLHSESSGERPPKGNWFLALMSMLFLGCSYFLAITSAESQIALNRAPIVMGLILVGTYLLFICVSVFICKALQRNKRYYYQTAHFVTVSSMTYRMKRNGASLASICILVSAILVLLTGSVSFYVGVKQSIEAHYPYDMGVIKEIPNDVLADELTDGNISKTLYEDTTTVLQEQNVQNYTETSFSRAGMIVCMKNGVLDLSTDTREVWNGVSSFPYYNREEMPEGEKICFAHFISLHDYNALCGTSEVLSDDEMMLGVFDTTYQADHIILPDGEEMPIKTITEKIPNLPGYGIHNKSTDAENSGELWLITPELQNFLLNTMNIENHLEENFFVYRYEYGVYLPDDYDRVEDICSDVRNALGLGDFDGGEKDFTVYSHPQKVDRAKGVAGGLLFVMIVLNIVFAFVTTLIMYYKQISEGYEDSKRFVIMRKVGMKTEEIKQSINSQMLTVFGLPLLVAGMHILLTSNIIRRVLTMAISFESSMIYIVMVVGFLLFAVVYAGVYLMTSRTYYKIVNSASKE